MTELRNTNIKAQDSFSIDAFGRWRVSNPTTLFDSKTIFDNPDLANSVENTPLFFDNAETSGSGTSTSLRINEASQRISVGNLTAGTRVRQSKQRFNYQSGKSQEIIITFCMNSLDAGVTKRAGYFDSNNGLFLELAGETAKLVQRSYVTGAVVDDAVSQSSWNIDQFDGAGPSGVTLDFTKSQILFIDFEWLGVGRVRMGFVVDGVIYYAHEFLNANNLTTVYMSTPNLPIRWEISNDGTGAASDLDCNCSSVISEGGVQQTGAVKYTSTTTLVDCNATNTFYAIIGIRLKTQYLAQIIDILNVDLIEVAGTKTCEWRLLLNPTVAGAFSYSDVANTSVQAAYGATANTVTGGLALSGGYFASDQRQGGFLSVGVSSNLRLGSQIDGTRDTIVLAVRNINGDVNSDVYGSLTWREAT